jgi:hypothetical protein
MEPSDPCLSLRNFQTPVSVYETFRPLSLPTEPSDLCLSQLKLQIPVSTYGHFRPLSHAVYGTSDRCLGLRNLQTPVSVYGTFRPLSQSKKPSDPIVSCCYSKNTSFALSFPNIYSGHVPRYPSCSLIGNEKIQESDPAPNGPSHKIFGPCLSNKSD